MGRASALGKGSGSQIDLLTLWHDGRAEIIPFRYMPVLLGGKGISHVGWDERESVERERVDMEHERARVDMERYSHNRPLGGG